MKELSIEEKSRRYDEAIERAKSKINNDKDHVLYEDDVIEIFPELKESDDEKIRRNIIAALKGEGYYDCDLTNECIAWLEKQGKETSWKPSKEEMDVLYGLAYITNQYDEHKEEVITRLYQDLKREFFNGSSYENMFPTNTSTEDDVRRRSTIQVLEYARSLDAYNQFGKADIDKNIAWLEKQGEQHSAIRWYDVSLIPQEMKELLVEWDSEDATWHEVAFYNADTKTFWNGTRQVKNVTRWCYIIDLLEKQGEQNPFDYENANIQQKDFAPKVEPKFKNGQWIVWQDKCYKVNYNGCGYELIDQDGLSTSLEYSTVDDNAHFFTIQDAKDGDMIYVSTEEKGIQAIFYKFENGFIYFHCFLCGDFTQGGYEPIGDIELVYPLQKTHHQRFFQKMKEAGYEWDAEKKELKKIEQKPTDEKMKEALRTEYEKGRADAITEMQVAWSEDDEKNLQGILDEIEANKSEAPEYDIDTYNRFIDWLKSLRPQNTWKPSEEQIASITCAVRKMKESACYDSELVSLFNDLKKLKG